MKRRADDSDLEEGEIATTALPMTERERQFFEFKNFSARRRSPSPLHYDPVSKNELVAVLMENWTLDVVLDACDLCRRALGRDVLRRALETRASPVGRVERIRPGQAAFDFLACVSIASKWYSRDSPCAFDAVAPDISAWYAGDDVAASEIAVLKRVAWTPFPIDTLRR